jgi:putative thioredoxin
LTLEFGKGQEPEHFNVPALTIEVDEESIRDYLALSDQLPLLVLFVGSDPASNALKQSIEALTNNLAGELLTLVIDGEKYQSLANAFEVTQLPTVYGLLKGQPAPLFAGNQPAEQIQLVIDRVIEVAKENGLTGKVSVKEQPQEPELTEVQRLAFDLIEKQDYQGAKAMYERALLENPADSLSEEGLAQVKLLIRLEGKDLASATNQNTSPLERADALIATGQAQLGFQVLLELFEKSDKEDREELRLRLVELFLVVGAVEPSVVEARRKLSLLLF